MNSFVLLAVLTFFVSGVLAALVAMIPVLIVRIAARSGWRYTKAMKIAFWVVFCVMVAAGAWWVVLKPKAWPVFVFLAWAVYVQVVAREWAAKLLQFYDTAKAEAKL